MLKGSDVPVLMVMGTLTTAYLMPLVGRWRRLAAPLALAAQLMALMGALWLVQAIRSGAIVYHVGGWAPPIGIQIVVDGSASLMLVFMLLLGSLVTIYSSSEDHSGWYYTAYLLMMAAMMGIVMTNDLFNLFVFMEVTTISACALVAAARRPIAVEAAFKYLTLATIGSGFILTAIGLLYVLTGHLNLSWVAAELGRKWEDYPTLMRVISGFLLVGFSVKAALFPLHVWLPDAHSAAPSPSSAVLSGLVVKAYIFGFFRLLVALGPILEHFAVPRALMALGSLGILGGSAFALVQRELKRRLAFSTVTQIGYVFLGIGLGGHFGLTGAFYTIMAHGVMKACLFLASGAMIHHTGRYDVEGLRGLGGRMPLVAAAFSFAALSMIGLPLTAGFVGKWYLFQGLLEAGQPLGIAVVILGSLLNAAYFLPLIGRLHFIAPVDAVSGRLHWSASASLLGLMALVALMGMVPGLVLNPIDFALGQLGGR